MDCRWRQKKTENNNRYGKCAGVVVFVAGEQTRTTKRSLVVIMRLLLSVSLPYEFLDEARFLEMFNTYFPFIVCAQIGSHRENSASERSANKRQQQKRTGNSCVNSNDLFHSRTTAGTLETDRRVSIVNRMTTEHFSIFNSIRGVHSSEEKQIYSF